ncbi:MAG: hypothetical protein JWQ22_2583 [Devosia sp.]|nr:hypothetical protein [Devosia sp.]
MTDRSIHVALTFDDNFWAPAYATMRSICLFSKRRTDLVFHLLHRTLTPQHKVDLEAIASEFGASLRWYDLDQSSLFQEFSGRLRQSRQFPAVVYARLLIDRLLPAEVTRIVYLDCDTMVRDDIAALFDWDMEGNPVAAVRDLGGAWIVAGRDVRGNRDIFDVAASYFNSGVMLIDVAGWRAANIVDYVQKAEAEGIMQRIYYDQDLLNLVFRGRWLQLPWRWNTIDARPVHEGLDPAILHYTGKAKPWFIITSMRRSVAFTRFYRHIMTNKIFYDFARHRRNRWWRKVLRLDRA